MARSAILNEGQKFSIQDYRSDRSKIYESLKVLLKQLFSKNHFYLLNLYVKSISFGQEINSLNLKRVLNNIYNEKALYTKKIALTVAETELQINKYKNQVDFITANAKCLSQAIVKEADIDFSNNMESIHATQFNYSLNELNYTIGSNKKGLKQRLSYIYLYTLMNHDNLKIYPRDYLTNNFLTKNI